LDTSKKTLLYEERECVVDGLTRHRTNIVFDNGVDGVSGEMRLRADRPQDREPLGRYVNIFLT
jgi:hypothetical protein